MWDGEGGEQGREEQGEGEGGLGWDMASSSRVDGGEGEGTEQREWKGGPRGEESRAGEEGKGAVGQQDGGGEGACTDQTLWGSISAPGPTSPNNLEYLLAVSILCTQFMTMARVVVGSGGSDILCC